MAAWWRPRRPTALATQTADALLRKEHAWVPALAPRLPLPVPVPQRLGEPSERFPRPWIVTTWIPGTPADRVPATRGAEAADALAAFLTALHQPAPAGAPDGRGRGGPLADLADYFASRLAAATDLGLIPDSDAVRAVWDDAVAAPAWAGPSIEAGSLRKRRGQSRFNETDPARNQARRAASVRQRRTSRQVQ